MLLNPRNKNFVSIAFFVALTVLPAVALAQGGSDASSQEGWEMVNWFRDLMSGWLGALIALIAFFSGIITWVVLKNPWWVLFSWFIGVLLVKGPAMLLTQFSMSLI